MANAAARPSNRRGFENNRLLRRFAMPTLVEVEWLTARHRTGIRRRLVTPVAEVLDLSMGGMLIEVPGKPLLRVNSKVELASEGNRATARVAHKHVAIDPDKQLLGIEFIEMSKDFETSLHTLVLALRT
jgi:hypothetical protein